jgi:hypothetical protein
MAKMKEVHIPDFLSYFFTHNIPKKTAAQWEFMMRGWLQGVTRLFIGAKAAHQAGS